MIPSEQLIKKPVVDHSQYNQDSDDELNNQFMQMAMNGGNGRAHAKNGRRGYQNGGNHGRGGHHNSSNRKKRSNRKSRNEHIYDDDSDFEEDDQKKKEEQKNKKFLKKQSFDKVQIKPVQPMRQISGLSQLIKTSTPIINGDNYGRGHGRGYDDPMNPTKNFSKLAHYGPDDDINSQQFHTFILTVYFGEYLDEEPLKLEITAAWSVDETINRAIQKWKLYKPHFNLKSSKSRDYQMRMMDDDDIDDDLPAFSKGTKIHLIAEKIVGLQYTPSNYKNNPNERPYNSPNEDQFSSFNAGPNIMQFQNAKEQLFIKIGIPGPSNETHVLAIDKDATALTVRDLISLLNKKKHAALYHPQFFNFYFDGQTRTNQQIDRTKAIVDLNEPRSLIMLPRFLTQNDDVSEAYQFKLVKLANERREYHCTKIRNARKNKKRMLIVDRHRIVKKAMDDYNIGTSDHVPIDIASITDIHVVEKNNKQFFIEYKHVQKGGSRQQVYELENASDTAHIVRKIKYLCTLRKLQGI